MHLLHRLPFTDRNFCAGLFAVGASLLILAILVLPQTVKAEPWLANRYAQNCASCHSPSRLNVVTKDKRCTVTCQGCHVNPNGGGMRNEYGVWNQQRWLRSFKSTTLKSKGTPAPTKHQKYTRELTPEELKEYSKDGAPLVAVKGVIHRDTPYSRSRDDDMNTKGAAGKSGKKSGKPGSAEGKTGSSGDADSSTGETAANADARANGAGSDGSSTSGGSSSSGSPTSSGSSAAGGASRDPNAVVAAGSPEFMSHLTSEDPYRIERRQTVFAGGDFRYFYLNYKEDLSTGTDTSYDAMLAMYFDLGVKIRPTKEHVNLVSEHRYFQIPDETGNTSQSAPERVFQDKSQVRSAYVKVDNLSYNTYAMYGLYRPQFGYYTPNHSTLLNSVMFGDNTSTTLYHANSAAAINKAITLGGSLDIPFANFSIIMPMEETIGSGTGLSSPFAQEKGYTVTLGANFDFLSSSIMASWWSTKGPRNGVGDDLKNDMISLTAGFNLKNLIVNFDMTKIDRERQPEFRDTGCTVNTFDVKYRFFREMYGVFNYATSNVARNLHEGSGSEIMVGAKTYLFSGSEFELLLVNRTDEEGDTSLETKTTGVQAQFHLFF